MGINVRLSRIVTRSDVWVGLFFALSGMAVLLEAREFEGSAARLPLLCAALLTMLGAALTLRASFVATDNSLDGQLLKTIASGPLPVAILLLAWVYLLAQGFGFFAVGVPMVMGIVHLMGRRHLARNAISSLIIVGLVFVVFYMIFGVRLPVSWLFAYAFSG